MNLRDRIVRSATEGRIARGAAFVARESGAQGIVDYAGGKGGKKGLAKGVLGLAGTLGSLVVGGVALKAVAKTVKTSATMARYGAKSFKRVGTNPTNLGGRNYVDKASKKLYKSNKW